MRDCPQFYGIQTHTAQFFVIKNKYTNFNNSLCAHPKHANNVAHIKVIFRNFISFNIAFQSCNGAVSN